MTRHLDMLAERPRTRGACADGARPCPWASCRHHLLFELTKRGKFKMRAEEPDQLAESCSLDVADRGGMSLHEIGHVLGVSRELVRQVADLASAKLRAVLPPDAREDWAQADGSPSGDEDGTFTDDFHAQVARAYRRIVLGETTTPAIVTASTTDEASP